MGVGIVREDAVYSCNVCRCVDIGDITIEVEEIRGRVVRVSIEILLAVC